MDTFNCVFCNYSTSVKGNYKRHLTTNKHYKNRIIFDGYPRNLNQAKNLDSLLKKYKQKIDIVLKLSVSLQTIKKRILEFQNFIKNNFENVGNDFAYKARSIHYNHKNFILFAKPLVFCWSVFCIVSVRRDLS